MSVSEWGPDNPEPAARVDAGATNAPDPGPSADETVQAATGELSGSREWAAVEALAARLEPEAFDPDVKAAPEWRERAQIGALVYAGRAIAAGYRLVSEDDTTVDRLAEVMWAEYVPEVVVRHHPWRQQTDAARDEWRRIARAAVRALREETP